jgi:SAM-dependent methyltransferase
MVAVSECPICSGNIFEPHMICTDHTVSHETFQLVRCAACNFIVTSPRPDDEQLARYYLSKDYVSHSKNAKGFFHNLYQVARYFTLNWKTDLVSANTRSITNPSVLDYGCGTGAFMDRCKKKGFSVTGIEPSEIARQNAYEEVKFEIYPNVNAIGNTFDSITLWHVLEHIPDLNEVIPQLKNKLSKNGMMFIAVPNHHSKDALHYKQAWAGFDVPRHLWHFSDTTMKRLLTKHGLFVRQILPMKLDAFYVSMLSEKYNSGRQGLAPIIKGFLQGLRSNASAKSNNQYSSLIYIAHK